VVTAIKWGGNGDLMAAIGWGIVTAIVLGGNDHLTAAIGQVGNGDRTWQQSSTRSRQVHFSPTTM